MAYGNLVDYESGPAPGTYTFRLKDGRRFTSFGPEAEAFKKRLDEAKASMPQPTADLSDTLRRAAVVPAAAAVPGLGPALVPVAVAYAAGKSATEPRQGQTVTEEPRDEQGRTVEQRVAEMHAQQAAATAPAAAAAEQAAGLVELDGRRYKPAGPGLFIGEDGRLYTHQAPSAGSKGGLVEKSRTVQHGRPIDEEYEAERRDQFISEKAAAALGFEAADEMAAAEKAFEQRSLEHARSAERERAAEADLIRSRVQELDAEYERRKQEFANAKVDPRRLTAGGKGWLQAFAVGLGTFGAGLARTPNYALQIFEQRVADDIKAQEAELAVKRDAADNAYKRLLQETGSSELAKKELAGLQRARLRAELEVMARNGKDKQRQAQALAMLAEMDRQEGIHRQERLQAAYGVVTSQIVNVPGRAPSAGGIVPVHDQLGTARALQEFRKNEAELAQGQKLSTDKPSASKAQRLAEIKAAKAAIIAQREKDERYGRPYIVMSQGGILASDAAKDITSGVNSLAAGVGRAIEGNAPNESSMNDIKQGMMSRDPGQRERAYQNYLQRLTEQERAILEAPDIAPEPQPGVAPQ